MQDINLLSAEQKEQIAFYIKQDNLEKINRKVTIPQIKDSFYTKYIKRLIDIIVSLIAILVTAPINLIILVVTFFDVGFPLIFKQYRTGKDEKQFVIYKFRNMTNAKGANGELLPPTLRVTKWGKFVRKTSLDELLNFISILKGDMSIIGPRPLITCYKERMNNRHKAIFKIRPGLECPSLEKLDHAISWQERLDNYVWYTENCTFILDLRLVLRILETAVDKKSTSARSKAETGGFMGYDSDGKVIDSKSVPDKYIKRFLEQNGYNNLEEAFINRQ